MLLPGKGAIAFLASVDIGLTTLLGAYTTEFYRASPRSIMAGPSGQHAAHASFEQLSQGSDVLRRNNVQTFTLEGDPCWCCIPGRNRTTRLPWTSQVPA